MKGPKLKINLIAFSFSRQCENSNFSAVESMASSEQGKEKLWLGGIEVKKSLGDSSREKGGR